MPSRVQRILLQTCAITATVLERQATQTDDAWTTSLELPSSLEHLQKSVLSDLCPECAWKWKALISICLDSAFLKKSEATGLN